MRKWSLLGLSICLILALAVLFCACENTGDTSSSGGNSIDVNDPSIVYDSNPENFTFGANQSGDGYVVRGYKGTSEFIEIPSVYNGSKGELPVVGISYKAFYYAKDPTWDGYKENAVRLKGIKIPDTVTEIGENAFGHLLDLTEIVIPDSVQKIGFGAFNGCSSLKKMTLPFVGNEYNGDENTHFGYIFSAEIWNNNADYIPNSLEELVITKERVISEGDLAYLYNVKKITLNEGITEIDKHGLWFMQSLESLVIPNTVTRLGDSCLNGLSSLKDLTLPFLGPSLGNFVTGHIGYIFGAEKYTKNSQYMPEGLEKVTLTNQERVVKGAFYGVNSLKTIVLSDNVIDISDEAFTGCKSLVLNEKDGIFYMGGLENDYLLAMDAKESLTTATIDENCIGIVADCFSLCQRLESVTIPDGVKKIGKNAFYRCKSLKAVTIPDSVELIGDNAFYGATSLESVTFSPSSNLSIIGECAFYDCYSLTEFTFTRSVNEVGKNAFLGCANLKKVNILNLGEFLGIYFESLYSNPFANATEIFVEGEKVTKIVVPNTVTSIKQYAFANLACVDEIVVSDTVSRVELWAFYGFKETQLINFVKARNGYTLASDWDFNSNATVTFSYVE